MGFTYKYEPGDGMVLNPEKDPTYARVLNTWIPDRSFPGGAVALEVLSEKHASLEVVLGDEDYELLEGANLIIKEVTRADTELTINAPMSILVKVARNDKNKDHTKYRKLLDANLKGYFPLELPEQQYTSTHLLRCKDTLSLGEDLDLTLTGLHRFNRRGYGGALGVISIHSNQTSERFPILTKAHALELPEFKIGIDCLNIQLTSASLGIYSL